MRVQKLEQLHAFLDKLEPAEVTRKSCRELFNDFNATLSDEDRVKFGKHFFDAAVSDYRKALRAKSSEPTTDVSSAHVNSEPSN